MKYYTLPLTKKQEECFKLLETTGIEEVLFGGAKGGAKSVALCYYAFFKAKQIVNVLKLKPTNTPLPVGFIGRKRAVDFNDTTLETWKAFIPSEAYHIRQQDKEIIIDNTVKILFGGLDDEDNIRKFNSAEFVFICIDQAEEISRDDMGMLRATLYRFKRPIPQKHYKVLLTANPADCWLKQDFIDNPPSNRRFLQALPGDNEFIDQNKYIQQLRDAFGHRPELISAYVDGSWEQLIDQDFVIKSEWIDQAKELKLPVRTAQKVVVSCDPAWTGANSDEIVIYAISNNIIIDTKCMYGKDTIVTAGEIVKLTNQYHARMVVIDVIGIGAGVYDNVVKLLNNDRIKVVPVNSATSCDEDNKSKYINLRAQMWWEGASKIAEGKVPLNGDAELEKELKSVKYGIKNGKIKIEDKETIKSRLGRSPDRADCYIQGLFYMDKCPYNHDIPEHNYYDNNKVRAY